MTLAINSDAELQSTSQTNMTKTIPSGARLLIFDLAHILVKKQTKGVVSVRPHVVPFLRSILEDEYDYSMAIWSGMKAENVEKAIEELFTDKERAKILFIWGQEECTSLPEFKQTRDLERVWHQYPQYSAANTTVFVDKEYKVMEPHQECCMILPEYEGPRKAKGDCIFADLKSILDERFLF